MQLANTQQAGLSPKTLGVDNAQRPEALRRDRDMAMSTWRRSSTAAVEALASTMEARDAYTAGHQNNVADLSVAIGRALGLPARQIEGLRLGAMIHDIGKITVSMDILAKPGKLSDDEFTAIKAHAQTGHDILSGVEFPWPLAQMVLQHHERLDGTGYPNGLKGDAILIEARIIAVADVVEAMTLARPYRDALGLQAALEELKQGRGRIYDAAVVDACLRVFANGAFAFTGGTAVVSPAANH